MARGSHRMWLPAADNAFHVGYALAYHADPGGGTAYVEDTAH